MKRTMLSLAVVPVVVVLSSSLLRGAPEEGIARELTRLIISSDGMLLEVNGEPPRRFSSIDDVVRAVPGLRGEFAVEDPRAASERPEPAARKKGPTARIEEGEIAVLDLARFLADATGLPVIHDSNDTGIAGRKVTVARPIEEATGEIVKQILEVNRIRVREERLGGRLTLRLESMGEDGGFVEPTPRPIVIPEAGGGEPAGKKEGAVDPRAAPQRVAKGPDPGQLVHRGMTLAPLPEVLAAQLPEDEDRGVLVESVALDPTGGAPGLGVLKRFDVVTHVGAMSVSSPENLVAALGLRPPGERIEIRVLRKGVTRILRGEAGAK